MLRIDFRERREARGGIAIEAFVPAADARAFGVIADVQHLAVVRTAFRTAEARGFTLAGATFDAVPCHQSPLSLASNAA